MIKSLAIKGVRVDGMKPEVIIDTYVTELSRSKYASVEENQQIKM